MQSINNLLMYLFSHHNFSGIEGVLEAMASPRCGPQGTVVMWTWAWLFVFSISVELQALLLHVLSYLLFLTVSWFLLETFCWHLLLRLSYRMGWFCLEKASVIRKHWVLAWLVGFSLIVYEVSYNQGQLGVNKIQNYYAHFIDEKAETQSCELSCLKPHS